MMIGFARKTTLQTTNQEQTVKDAGMGAKGLKNIEDAYRGLAKEVEVRPAHIKAYRIGLGALGKTIEGVGVVSKDGKLYMLPRPYRHHHIVHSMAVSSGDGPWAQEDDGFITDTGWYVCRPIAWLIAQRAGQLLERAPTDGRGGELYSEDVW